MLDHTPLIMFFVFMLASFTGPLFGGASMITIPILILLGVPAHTAIGVTTSSPSWAGC